MLYESLKTFGGLDFLSTFYYFQDLVLSNHSLYYVSICITIFHGTLRQQKKLPKNSSVQLRACGFDSRYVILKVEKKMHPVFVRFVRILQAESSDSLKMRFRAWEGTLPRIHVLNFYAAFVATCCESGKVS